MKYIIATHGRLAEGYVETLKMFTTEDNIHALCAYSISGDSVQEDLDIISSKLNREEPVIIFTDVFGGSVTQEIVKYFESWDASIYAGINLPFVLEVILQGDSFDKSNVNSIIEDAKNQLVDVTTLLQMREVK